MRSAARKRSKSEGWVRVVSMGVVNERAHRKADEKLAKLAEVGSEVGAPTSKSIELAEDIRADVLDRHRTDWAACSNTSGSR